MADEFVIDHDDDAEYAALLESLEAPSEFGSDTDLSNEPDYAPTLDESKPGDQIAGPMVEADGVFYDAIQRGIDNTHASLYAASHALGSLTGIDGVIEWGEEGMIEQMRQAAENPSHLDPEDDIDTLGEIGTYVAEAIGEQFFNIGMVATGAGAGAWAAKAALGKAAVGYLERTAAGKVALNEVAKKGAFKGVMGTVAPLEAGGIQQEFVENDIDAPGLALFAGIPAAALEGIGGMAILKQMFKGVPQGSIGNILKETAKGFGAASLVEMPTEVAQEVVALTARKIAEPDFELFTDENYARLAEAGIKGGIAGGFTGGAFRGGSSLIKTVGDLNTGPALDEVIDEADQTLKFTAPSERERGYGPEDVARGHGYEGDINDPAVNRVFRDIALDDNPFSPENEAKAKAAMENVIPPIPEGLEVEIPVTDDNGVTEQVKVPATEAVAAVNENIDVLDRLRKCMG